MPDLDCKTCFCLEIPMLEYSAALALQHHLVSARQTGVIENDIVLILERPCVFTLGRSVGISVKRGVSFHGLALNVNLSLEPFQWIHPCGLINVAVTSMAQELSKTISMKPVREAMKYYLASVLGINLVNQDISFFLKNYTNRDIFMTLSRPA
jgi:lipoate-protein ligase B